jgi:LuxR family maltose regulon positive regulatory protein
LSGDEARTPDGGAKGSTPTNLGAAPWSRGKITPPAVRAIVRNARQIDRLEAALDTSAVWLHGSPGAGKTTLIANWLATRRQDPIWLRLDPDDSDPATFFFHIGAAEALARRADRSRLPTLSPAYQHDPRAFSRAVFRKLFGAEPGPLVVLDDYQEIDSASPVHDYLARAVNELPPGARLIVISRSPPPKEFARARVNGALEVVAPDILRLDAAEAEELARARALSLDVPLIDRLVEVAQGWVAGLILLMEAFHAGAARAADSAPMTPELLFDYFAIEVLQDFDETERRDLLLLSQMPTLTARAAHALTGDAGAGALLERLCHRNYFTVRDAQAEPNYRFHPLFREFLAERLKRTRGVDELRRIRLRAAEALEDCGQPDAAAERLREASAWEELAGLINRWARRLEASGRQKTILAWLAMLPEERVRGDGWLSYWSALALAPFAAAPSRPMFRSAFDAFARSGDTQGVILVGSGLLDALATDHFAHRDELREVVAALRAFLREHPVIEAPLVELRFAVSMYGALNQCSADRVEIASWRDRMFAAAERSGDPAARGLPRMMVVIHGAVDGDYARVREYVGAVPPPEALGEAPEIQALCFLGLIVAQSHRQAPGSVVETAEAALAATERSGVRGYSYIFATYAAGDCLRKGDAARAAVWVARIGEMMDLVSGQRAAYYYYCACGLELLNGNGVAAIEAGERAIALARASAYPYLEALSRLVLAQTHIELGDLDALERQLAGGGRALAASASDSLRFPLALLQAEAASLRGRSDEGLTQLRDAMAIGERLGSRRTYMNPPLAPRLLARALAHDIAPDFARLLIQSDDLPPPTERIAQWPWPLKIVTFGGFRLLKDGEPLALSRKTPKRLFTLLKAILAFGGRDVPREQILDAVWIDEDGDAARQSFDTAIYRLRKIVDDSQILVLKNGRVGFNPARCWIDAWAFEEGLAARSASRENVLKTLRLYGGDFLPDDDDLPWARAARKGPRARFLKTAESLARESAAVGDWTGAAEIHRLAIGACPDDEPSYQGLMRCLDALGRADDAARVYDDLRVALARAGRAPGVASQAALRALRGGTADRVAAGDAPAT